MTNKSVISVKNLKKTLTKTTSLNVEEFGVPKNEVVSILGANGAGKSTFLRVLGAIESFEEGTLQLFEKEVQPSQCHPLIDSPFGFPSLIYKEFLALRRQVSLVLQKPQLLDISVIENVKTGLKFRNYCNEEATEIACQWLKLFNVSHLEKRNGHELSGGEIQRVSLARSFAVSPQVLLLDEPFSQLDQPARNALMDTLSSIIQERKQSAVLVTHERNEVVSFSSRVSVMSNGAILQEGKVDHVFSNPCCREVKSFVSH